MPILPDQFAYKPLESARRRLGVLGRLLHRGDVTSLVNGCDAGREGELIFWEIVRHFNVQLPIERLWLQSMTQASIREAFAQLRSGPEYAGLAAAARCRAWTDWLLGMNMTRALTVTMGHLAPGFSTGNGRSEVWSIGRVQTPTLKLLVDRELEVMDHEPKPFWRLKARFSVPPRAGAAKSDYDATWFRNGFTHNPAQPDLKDDRIWTEQYTKGLQKECEELAAKNPQTVLASESSKRREQPAPDLFQLTSLQKYLASKKGWTAKRTLDAAQRCYERHKVITYPRTSSAYLPSDYQPEVQRVLKELGQVSDFARLIQGLRTAGLRNTKRIFQSAKVTDHFAIIPTGVVPKNLSGDDLVLWQTVVRRFIAAFMSAAVISQIKRITRIGDQHFRTGPIDTVLEPGWQLAYHSEQQIRPSAQALAPLPVSHQKKSQAADADRSKATQVELVRLKSESQVTRPPPRYSEASLLGLMERAGQQTEDRQYKAALRAVEGLGTAATRADIIQNLKTKNYVDQTLRPTAKGIILIQTLGRLGLESLQSVELTAKMEMDLQDLEDSTSSAQTDSMRTNSVRTEMPDTEQDVGLDVSRQADGLMAQVASSITAHVETVKRGADRSPYTEAIQPSLGCPQCSQKIVERTDHYGCASEECYFSLPKTIMGRYLHRRELRDLLGVKRQAILTGLLTAANPRQQPAASSGSPAILKLQEGPPGVLNLFIDGKLIQPSVSDRAPQASSTSGSTRQPIGVCPVHSGDCSVIETARSYLCTSRLNRFRAGINNPEGFMIPKTVCRLELPKSAIGDLIKSGQTREIKGFKSKAGRDFAARLVLTPSGGFSFAFAKD